jgi:hypothetical protein
MPNKQLMSNFKQKTKLKIKNLAPRIHLVGEVSKGEVHERGRGGALQRRGRGGMPRGRGITAKRITVFCSSKQLFLAAF